MPRAVWSGAISFGLVNVPVKVYSAQSQKDIRFHQLHGKDGSRIQQKRFCAAEQAEVPYEEIVKGYEVAPDQYVTITPDELDALDPEATRTIDILDFVPQDQIDPMFYERAYYLVPDKGSTKPYGLLLEAMERAGRVAIARVVMRTKEYLAAVRPAGDALVMSTMLFGDEVVQPDAIEELPQARPKVDDREVRLAEQLIGALATDFDPGKYKDTHRERVLELIERKAAGETIEVAPAAPAPKAPRDLAAALEASLAAAAKRKGEAKPEAAAGGR